MVDQFVVHSHQSYGSRIGNSFKALCFAPIFLIVGIWLLVWNEGNAVHQRKALDEGLKNVVDVGIDKLDPNNRDKLIHFIGPTTIPTDGTTGQLAVDTMFGVAPKDSPLKLKRLVEMLQWTESKESHTRKNTGGSTDTVTTYTYKKEWKNNVIDSNNFHDPAGHENPTTGMRFDSKTIVADPIKVGAFTLTNPVLAEMEHPGWYKTVESTSLSVDSINDESTKKDAIIYGNYFYFSTDGNRQSFNTVGDTRVGFEEIPSQTISVVAKQMIDDSLNVWAKGLILLVEAGAHDAEEMFQHAQDQLTMQTWLIRAGGFLVVFIGFSILMKPLSVFADVLPCVGNLVEAGTSCLSFFAALIVSIVVIAVAWLAYRPIFSAFLLGICGGLGYLFYKKRSKNGPQLQMHSAVPTSPTTTGGEIPMATAVPYTDDKYDDNHDGIV